MKKNNRAIPWLLAWSLIYTISISFTKKLDASINTLTLVFFRALFGFIFLIPGLIKNGFLKTIIPKAPVLISARALFMMLSMLCTYTAYRALELSVATTIGFTQSMIMTTLAAFLLKENVTLKRWAIILIGYTGVLFITKPAGNWSFQPEILVALGANLLASMAIIVTKKLTVHDSPLTIVALPFLAIMVLSGLLNTYFGWVIPSPKALLFISVIAGGLTFTQYAYVKALTHCDASFAAPFEYLRLIAAIPIGCLYFCEVLEINKIAGAFIIILSNFYLIRSNKS
jgi:drug/metabolite transporter (DMT)-like permease